MYINWKNINVNLGDFTLNFNLQIDKGELVTLLGPSGCGKTTALRVAAGLQAPDSGKFYINNKDLTNAPPSERNIGIVFQNYALFPHMNVEENISYGLKKRKKEYIDDVNYILDKLKLAGYNKRRIDSLSGGEKQRVALGRSLAIKPDLLLLDEPLSALDAKLRKELRKEIKDIHKSFGITTLYVTHDQDEALVVSDRIVLMNRGIISQIDTPYNLYNYPTSEFSANFLGESNIINHKNKRIFFRPEFVSTSQRSGALKFYGDIIESEYLGQFYRVTVKTKCNNILKLVSNELPSSRSFYIDESKIQILN